MVSLVGPLSELTGNPGTSLPSVTYSLTPAPEDSGLGLFVRDPSLGGVLRCPRRQPPAPVDGLTRCEYSPYNPPTDPPNTTESFGLDPVTPSR